MAGLGGGGRHTAILGFLQDGAGQTTGGEGIGGGGWEEGDALGENGWEERGHDQRNSGSGARPGSHGKVRGGREVD